MYVVILDPLFKEGYQGNSFISLAMYKRMNSGSVGYKGLDSGPKSNFEGYLEFNSLHFGI